MSAGRIAAALALSVVMAWTAASPSDDAGMFGGKLYTEDDMVPRVSVRFDDMGSRSDHAIMALEFLKRGIPITIGVNAWSVDAGDSAQIDSILTFERDYGTEVEWYQHTNGNMIAGRGWPRRVQRQSAGARIEPDLASIAPRSNFLIDDNSLATTDWRYYTAWRWNDWVAELDPTPIERLTGERPTFIVWPGDAGRRQFVKRNLRMFETLLDTLGYDFALTGIAQNDTTWTPVAGLRAGDANTTRIPWLHPFMFASYSLSRANLPMPGTFDLGSGGTPSNVNYVERFAPGDPGAPDWVPPGTERWTLAENIPYYDGAGSAVTDYSTGNARTTWRWVYETGIAAGGGFCLVLHSEDATLAQTIDPSYPSGDATTGGVETFGEWFDVAYMAATIEQLAAEGFVKPVTLSEHVKWLASEPGRPGLRVYGTDDFRSPSHTIGDTAGVEMPFVAGGGVFGMTGISPFSNSTLFNSELTDDDHNGKFDDGAEITFGLTHNSGSNARLGFLPGVGHKNNQAVILYDNGNVDGTSAAELNFVTPTLPPGRYRLQVVAQQWGQVDLADGEPITLNGWTYSYEQPASSAHIPHLLNFNGAVDSLHVVAGTTEWDPPANWWPAFVVGGGGDDDWNEGTALDLRSEGWWPIDIAFEVPDGFDASTVSPTQQQWYAMHGWTLSAEFTFERAGFDDYARISSVEVIWEGPLD